MTTMIDRYDRGDITIHDSIPIDEAARRIARDTNSDPGFVAQRLRAGDTYSTAGYHYRLTAMRPAGMEAPHAE